MAKARGKTKELVASVLEIQQLIEKAVGSIDTRRQYEIRDHLTEALKKCQTIRDAYDPE